MRALFYPEFDVLDVRNVPVPQPGAGEVILQVAACGICGSELETFHAKNPRRMPPIIMGHEFCGTVVAMGAGLGAELLGGRFVSNSLVSCGACASCRRGNAHLCRNRQLFGMHRPGAFAEYVAVPISALIPWPSDLRAEEACLAEPLANGIHVANLTRHIEIKSALVIGAGPIGLMCQQALQSLRNAEIMVCDMSEYRLTIAQRLGAVDTLRADRCDLIAEVSRWTEGEGVDLVVDAAGTAATKKISIAALRPGGGAVWIGLHTNSLDLDSYDITLPERQVLGTYAASKAELSAALELMREGKVDVTSWVETNPLDLGPEAFRRMLRPSEQDLKAVLIP